MVDISHQVHHLTHILQVCVSGRPCELPSAVPEDRWEERMGGCGSSPVAPLATDRDEDDCKRESSARHFPQRDGKRLPAYGVGGGV